MKQLHTYSRNGETFLKADHDSTEVVVKDGTEVIASAAFDSCRVKKITLPSSIRIIEDDAFLRAHELEEINLPEGITSIGFAAFRFCENLQSITLPHSLTHLGAYAFYGCSSLHTLVINGNFTWNESWFDKNPFSAHWGYYNPFGYIQSISCIKNTNPNFVVEDGALYSADKTVLFRCPVTNTSISMPRTLEFVLEFAFENCRYMEKIDLPSTVFFIGKDAFSRCDSIREFEIPKSVHGIPESCFSLCVNLAHLKLHKGIDEIDRDAFFGCYELEFIDYPRGHEKRLSQLMIDSGYEPVVHSPLRYSEYCGDIVEMLKWRGINGLKKIADENAKLVIQSEETISGIDKIINELSTRFVQPQEDRIIRYNVALHQYLGIDCIKINISRKKITRESQNWMLLIYIKGEKISTFVLGHSLYGTGRKSEFPWDKITKPGTMYFRVPNQMPCMHCGKLSNELLWVNVSHDCEMGGSRGVLSFCPDCHKQVQYEETLHYIANR
jgi:hypothetical protein